MTAPVLKPDSAALDRAARLLAEGGLVAMPTETVYGLAADASNADAVARLYAAKGRPAFNPLIAHCASAEAAFAQGRFSEKARTLAAEFWQGPLTFVVDAVDTTTSTIWRSFGISGRTRNTRRTRRKRASESNA